MQTSTSAQQPEPDVQQLTEAVMSTQACSIVAFISTQTHSYSRITVEKSLQTDFKNCPKTNLHKQHLNINLADMQHIYNNLY